MKNIMKLIMLVIMISLLGCQKNTEIPKIKEIHIYEYAGPIDEPSDLIVSADTTHHNEILDVFKEILKDAKKEDGIVNLTNPIYTAAIIYSDNTTQEISLWVSNEKRIGTLMYLDDTHTIYNFSEDLSMKLFNAINEI